MSVMKLEYAEDIYDIPFEEDQNGLFHPKFTNYGRAQIFFSFRNSNLSMKMTAIWIGCAPSEFTEKQAYFRKIGISGRTRKWCLELRKSCPEDSEIRAR